MKKRDLLTIDDFIEYLQVVKKHRNIISDFSATTDGRFGEFDSLDIKIRLRDLRIKDWVKSHNEFFRS